jgi:CDP-glucose 4,6-dehydratase
MMQNSYDFWKDKKVLVTSATSFLGAWTSLSLQHLGATVIGVAQESYAGLRAFEMLNTGQAMALYYGDMRDEIFLANSLNYASADIVIHLGEMGRLSESDIDQKVAAETVILGTLNLMELLRQTASVRSLVVVSSDKVYERSPASSVNEEFSRIAANEIIPTAKLCSELLALAYRKNYFHPGKYNKHKVAIATARIEAGFGGGDFQENSIFAQAASAFFNQLPLKIRNPRSHRPWIHVLDQVSGVLSLAQALYIRGPKMAETYNLGAQSYQSVFEVMNSFAKLWSAQAKIETPEEKMAQSPSNHARLNSELAKADLFWQPRWNLNESLKQTAEWYKDFYGNERSENLKRPLLEYWNFQL